METTFVRARRLRRDMTVPERTMWRNLRGRGLAGWKFRRQVPVGPFIVDFLCVDAGVALEIDGDQHGRQASYDLARIRYINACGYRVVRFSNHDLRYNTDAVLQTLREVLDKCPRQ